MKLHTYLNYGGNCRAAFEFYAEHLGGRITSIALHGDQPIREGFPADWSQKVLHARLELGDSVLMGADIPPDRFQPMRSAYMTLLLDTDDDAERVYGLLVDGGQIFMPLQSTFYASRFAMLRDRFGTSWMLMHETDPQ